VDSADDDAVEPTAVDPARVLRLRLVYALVTLLLGSVFALFSTTILGFALSGRLSLLFAAGAFLLAVGVLALLLRAALRALSASRPDSDELRSAAGLTSLASGFILLGADGLFLVFTFTVLLTQGGSAIVLVLPLFVLSYFTLQLVREATDDFLKRINLRRELRLFLTTLGYFVFTALVFLVLATASTVSPVVLVSPANGATVCPGTLIDFELSAAGSATPNATWDNGSGPQPLATPYDINTTGWPSGPATVTINVTDTGGASHSSRFNFTFSNARPPCA
jgi:hypothetical protein